MAIFDIEEMRKLKDFDVFFFYGQNELSLETKSDIMQNIIQPRRTLFYDRDLDSAGITRYENQPNAIALQINLPYDIVISISKRNQFVSAGEQGLPDRRVALSQNTIRLNSRGGEVDVTVQYIPLSDFKQTESTNFSLGLST